MALKGAVEIEAYDESQRLVHRQVIAAYNWYEELHPLVDSNEERAKIHVRRMQVKQYDDNGDLEEFSTLRYADTGTLEDMRVWRKDGTTEYRRFAQDSSH